MWINGAPFTPRNRTQRELRASLVAHPECGRSGIAALFRSRPVERAHVVEAFITDVAAYRPHEHRSAVQLHCVDRAGQTMIANIIAPSLWFIDVTQAHMTTEVEAQRTFTAILNNDAINRHILSCDVHEGIFLNQSNSTPHWWLRLFAPSMQSLEFLNTYLRPPAFRRAYPLHLRARMTTMPHFGRSLNHLLFAGLTLNVWARFHKIRAWQQIEMPHAAYPCVTMCTVHIDDVELCHDMMVPPPLIYASYDIEVANSQFLLSSEGLPNLNHEANIISHMSMTISAPSLLRAIGGADIALNLVVAQNPVVVADQLTITCATEAELMEMLTAFWGLIRPHILADYNGYNFDQPWIVTKLRHHNLAEAFFHDLTLTFYREYSELSWQTVTSGRVKAVNDQTSNRNMADVCTLNGVGIAHADVFYYVKTYGRYDKSQGASLDSMARQYNIERKMGISFTALNLAVCIMQLGPDPDEAVWLALIQHITVGVAKFYVSEAIWKTPGLAPILGHGTPRDIGALQEWAHDTITHGTAYCQHDAFICLHLAQRMGLFTTVGAWGSKYAATPREALTRGNTFYVTRAIDMVAFSRHVMVSRDVIEPHHAAPLERDLRAAVSRIGGITLVPRPSRLDTKLFTIIVDIKSSYPSHMEQWDICPTKFSLQPPAGPHHAINIPIEAKMDGTNFYDTHTRAIAEDGIVELSEEDLAESHTYELDEPADIITVYYADDKERGILNVIQTQIKAKRAELKTKIAAAKAQKIDENAEMVDVIVAQCTGQSEVEKRTAVSVYGATGFVSHDSNPFASFLLMASITATSAQTIIMVAEHIYMTFGLIAIAGVTDSLMLYVPEYLFHDFEINDMDDRLYFVRRLAEDITSEINAFLAHLYGARYVEVELDGIAMPFWIQLMKRYCYWSLNMGADTFGAAYDQGKAVVKGYNCVRSTSGSFSNDLFKRLIGLVLHPYDTELSLQKFNDWLRVVARDPVYVADRINNSSGSTSMLVFAEFMRVARQFGADLGAPPIRNERYQMCVRATFMRNSYSLSGRSRGEWKVGERFMYGDVMARLGIAPSADYLNERVKKALLEVLGETYCGDKIGIDVTPPAAPVPGAQMMRLGGFIIETIDPRRSLSYMWTAISGSPRIHDDVVVRGKGKDPATAQELVALWRDYVVDTLESAPFLRVWETTDTKQQDVGAVERYVANHLPADFLGFCGGARIFFAHLIDDALAAGMWHIFVDEEAQEIQQAILERELPRGRPEATRTREAYARYCGELDYVAGQGDDYIVRAPSIYTLIHDVIEHKYQTQAVTIMGVLEEREAQIAEIVRAGCRALNQTVGG